MSSGIAVADPILKNVPHMPLITVMRIHIYLFLDPECHCLLIGRITLNHATFVFSICDVGG